MSNSECEELLKQEAARRGLPLTGDVRCMIMQEWVGSRLIGRSCNPVSRLLSDVWEAQTQREIADIIAANRGLLTSLPKRQRDEVLKEIDYLADQIPEV